MAVLPGGDGLVILGYQTRHKEPNIDVMEGLKGTALGHGGTDGRKCERTASKPGDVSEVVSLRYVAVTMKTVKDKADAEDRAEEGDDPLEEELRQKGPAMVKEAESG